MSNSLIAFWYVALATSSTDISLNSAIFFAINLIFEESFLFPLFGSGERYGLSVSISNLLIGTNFTAFFAFFEFLKVIGPAKEI